MPKELKYQWECVTDKRIFKESEDKFNLDWEKEGKIKKFELKKVDGDSIYGVDFTKGNFNLNGKTQSEPNAINASLKFFRRNTVIMNPNGTPLSAKVSYFVGYLKKGRGRAIKIGNDDSVEIVDL